MTSSRLIARYTIEHADHFEVITRYADTAETLHLPKEAPILPSLAAEHPAAIWFERKMQDDFSLRLEGTWDTRPLVQQEHFPHNTHPLLTSFDATQSLTPISAHPYPYETVDGDGVFEVPVGPIHAGIIEPGHFQFFQAGERILHLEVRHFYKHRGIEKMLEGTDPLHAWPIVERISGTESLAYQIAWRDILLQATRTELPESLRRYHALLLEMERIVHHLTDLGFIPNDAGFGAALAIASRLAEDARRQLKTLTGHRFGFGAVRQDIPAAYDPQQLLAWVKQLEQELQTFSDWILDVPSLWDRFDTTGILSRDDALTYDAIGVVARASGLPLDRRDTPWYRELGWECITETSGDVAARFLVRLREVAQSLTLIRHLAEDAAPVNTRLGTIEDGRYEAFAESPLGELYLTADLKGGRIKRFFVRDPSFVNWQVLHRMMPGNIIADFPLINKSCDLSYAGNDL